MGEDKLGFSGAKKYCVEILNVFCVVGRGVCANDSCKERNRKTFV